MEGAGESEGAWDGGGARLWNRWKVAQHLRDKAGALQPRVKSRVSKRIFAQPPIHDDTAPQLPWRLPFLK